METVNLSLSNFSPIPLPIVLFEILSKYLFYLVALVSELKPSPPRLIEVKVYLEELLIMGARLKILH